DSLRYARLANQFQSNDRSFVDEAHPSNEKTGLNCIARSGGVCGVRVLTPARAERTCAAKQGLEADQSSSRRQFHRQPGLRRMPQEQGCGSGKKFDGPRVGACGGSADPQFAQAAVLPRWEVFL